MLLLISYLRRLWRHRRETGLAETSASAPGAAAAGAAGGARAHAQGASAGRRQQQRSPGARGPFALLAHQVHYDLLTSLRNPRARFFTFFFPILLLVVFNGVFGNGSTLVAGVHVKLSVFYVPGILAMSVVVATYASLVVSLTTLRETGVFKRRRATPVSPALLIAGQAVSAVVITAVMSALVLGIAKVFYGIGMAPAAIAAVACTVLLGTATFACVAYAVSGLIGSPEAAQPVVQATMLPLWFISGVFIPVHNLSGTLRHIGDLFPVEHLANSLHLASVNSSFGGAVSATDLLVLAAWGIGAAAFAVWRFSWLPSTAAA